MIINGKKMQESDLKISSEQGESNIDLGFDFSNDPEEYFEVSTENQSGNEHQRSDQWHKDRNGSITASIAKKLMACNSSGGKMTWNDKAKVYAFSSGIVKLVFEKMMERKENRYIETAANSQMKYGTKVEPLMERFAKTKLEKEGVVMSLVGFKSFSDLPHAGASSDALLSNHEQKPLESIEMKACTSWGTYYDRTFEAMNDKHMDFWQTQAQMKAWDVKKCKYVVAQPPQNIYKYLYAENIDDLYDEWIEECKPVIVKVKRSDVHVDAMVKRIEIVNECVNRALELDGKDLKLITYEVIDEFKKQMLNNEKSNKKQVVKDLTKKKKKKKKKPNKSNENENFEGF